MRTTKHFLLAASLFLMYGCTTGSAPHSDPGASESRVRERSTQLAAAEAAKDFEKAISFWLPDAVVHIEGAEAIRGLAAIRETYGQFFRTVLSFRGETESVVIASSGDLAYETGTNYMTVESPSGSTAVTSKYLSVWKRAPDGEWRVAAVAVTNNPTK